MGSIYHGAYNAAIQGNAASSSGTGAAYASQASAAYATQAGAAYASQAGAARAKQTAAQIAAQQEALRRQQIAMQKVWKYAFILGLLGNITHATGIRTKSNALNDGKSQRRGPPCVIAGPAMRAR
jgi:hypothetical protein